MEQQASRTARKSSGYRAIGLSVVSLMSGALLINAQPGQAQPNNGYPTGHWVEHVEWTGAEEGTFGASGSPSKSDTFSYDLKTRQYTDEPENFGLDGVTGYSGEYNSHDPQSSAYSIGVKAEGKRHGTWRLVWRWEPLYSGQDAGQPTDVTFGVLATGYGRAFVSNGGGKLPYKPDGTPNDETSFVSTGSASIDGKSADAMGVLTPSGDGTTWEAQKKRLFSVRTKGQATVKGPELSFDVTATAPDGRVYDYYGHTLGVKGYAKAYAGFSYQADPRSVAISSSIDPSYRRTMDTGQPLSKYRDQTPPQPFQAPMIAEVAAGLLNEPDSYGAMMGDTVVTRRNGQWQGIGGFVANKSGNWKNPTYAWSVGGESTMAFGYSTPENQPNSSLSLGLNLGFSTDGFPKSSVITVDVTDSDEAVGKNTYAITWHLPYEKTQDLPDGRQRKEVLWISDNPITPLGGGISATKIPPKPFDSLAAIDDVKVVAGAFGVPTGPLTELQEVFKAITNISEWGDSGMEINVTENQIMHTSDAFEGALSQNPDNIQGMTVATRDSLMAAKDYSSWKKYNCYGGYVRLHHEKNWLADHYDAHGFDSSNHLLHHDVIEQYRFENFYQKQITTPVSPTLGDREVPPSYNLS